jgi:isocitrate dehydrogenase
MKVTDGMFHRVFDMVAAEYPDIKNNHYIVDIGAAKIANKPELFDVIVTLNLYGDILSDIASEVSGSVGLAGSANIGKEYAMFEAVHGSAPDIAGKGIANPSGLLQAAVMMLEYIGQVEVAATIHNGWLRTLELGLHTADIYQESLSKKRLSTMEFAHEVVANLGRKPNELKPAKVKDQHLQTLAEVKSPEFYNEMIGVDIYLKNPSYKTHELADMLKNIDNKFELQHIAVRGIKVWPSHDNEEFSDDLWRLRYIKTNADELINSISLLELQKAICAHNLELVFSHNLSTWNRMAGFTKAQGE